MEKRTKILVGLVGIFVVALILLGLTYAYFLTQVTGNSNNKSVSVTTADIRLTYNDGNGIIELNKVKPNVTDTPYVTKTFSVYNGGNVSVEYGVFLENVTNTFTTKNDLPLVIECSTSQVGNTCDGYDDIMLSSNDMLLTNEIEAGETQTYTLTLDYVDSGTDQSTDMNKTVEAKIQIYGLNDTVDLSGTISDASQGDYIVVESEPKRSEIVDGKFKVVGLEPGSHTIKVYNSSDTLRYSKEITINKGSSKGITGPVATVTNDTRVVKTTLSSEGITITELKENSPFDSGTLANEIYLNAKKELNGTIYSATPLTQPANAISGASESTLSITPDDYRTSYYYRGNVIDNYVNFAGMCWRIVRIEGDGSIKIILEDQDSTCASSNGNWNIPTTTGGSTLTGNFGYTQYAINTLTASNGTTTNSGIRRVMDYLNGETDNASSMATAFKNFQIGTLTTNIASTYNNATINDYLKVDNWCMNDKGYSQSGSSPNYTYTELSANEMLDIKVANQSLYYDSYVRLYHKNPKEPTLKCNGTAMNKFGDYTTDMYVGTLTADEILYAGGKISNSNINYLINDYQKSEYLSWWSLSPYYFSPVGDNAVVVDSNGYLGISRMNYSDISFRPAVSLKSGTTISGGVGTKANPYVIE